LHIREWNLKELETYLRTRNLQIQFSGLTMNNDRDTEKNVSMIVLENNHTPLIGTAPSPFRVVALMAVFNEKDVLSPVIDYLNREGVEVYLIDNWSTDGTFELASQMLQRGLMGIERWPESGPSHTFDFRGLLRRKEELCWKLDANWFIHYDADEIRESPWKGVCLRDAICWVDQQGYNAIDFNSLNFVPVDNDYLAGSPLAEHFKFFEFGEHTAYFTQIKAWKKMGKRINLSKSGGHSVEFSSRKIYPYKFLIRHYPIRSQSHAERKIFHERKSRYDPVLKKQGWHNHYDIYVPGSNFLRHPDELLEFRSDFYANYLVERLSRIGITPRKAENNDLQTQWVEQGREIQAIMAQIKVKDSILMEIYAGRAWKLIQLLWRIRLKLLPRRSARERAMNRLFRFLRF